MRNSFIWTNLGKVDQVFKWKIKQLKVYEHLEEEIREHFLFSNKIMYRCILQSTLKSISDKRGAYTRENK